MCPEWREGSCTDEGGAPVRVVAGRAGSLRLKTVPGQRTRPTTDRVKESVFGILGEACLEARVLDLFAGTGSLGIEALSRGAARAVFVELDRGAARVLRDNLRSTGFTQQATILVKDVLTALRTPAVREQSAGFDLVLLDPPYGTGQLAEALEVLGRADAPLAAGALVVAEHSNHEVPPNEVGSLALWRRKRYGETVVSFYRRTTAGAERSGDEGGELGE